MANAAISQLGPNYAPPSGGTITGGGTLNYLAKFTPSGTAIGDSQFQDDGTTIGVNMAPVTGVFVSWKSKGSTSATYGAVHLNSSGTQVFALRDDGIIEGATTAGYPIMIGSPGMVRGVTVSYNTIIGNSAFTTASTATENTGVGFMVFSSLAAGSGHTAVGNQSAQNLASGTNNTYVGYLSGFRHTGGNDNVFIGTHILFSGSNRSTTGNTIIGTGGAGLITGNYNTMIGSINAFSVTSGDDNVFIGRGIAYSSVTVGNANVFIGPDAAGDQFSTSSPITPNGLSYAIAIGSSVRPSASNQLVIGGISGFINDVYIGNNPTNASPVNVKINATGGYGTNIAGATFTIAGGRGTGTGAPGTIIFQTSEATTSGSTQQTLSTKYTINAVSNGGTVHSFAGSVTTLTGTASGTFTGAAFNITGTPTYTAGSFIARTCFYSNGGTCPEGVTVTESLGGIFQSSWQEAVTTTGGVTKFTGIRIITLGSSTSGPNTATEIGGLDSTVANRTKITTLLYGVRTTSATGGYTGAVTTAVAFEINAAFAASVNVVNWSGLRIPAISGPTGSIWGLDITGTMNNRIAGSVAIGTSSAPDAGLDVQTTLYFKRTSYNSATSNIGTEILAAIDCSGGAITVNLPNGGKRFLIIKDTTGNAFTNNITLTPAGGQTIDGAASFVMNINYQSVTLMYDGTSNWEVL